MARCQYRYWDGQQCRYERYLERVEFGKGREMKRVFSKYCYYHHKQIEGLFDLESHEHRKRGGRRDIEL